MLRPRRIPPGMTGIATILRVTASPPAGNVADSRDPSARIWFESGPDLLSQCDAIDLAHVDPWQGCEKMHLCECETGNLSGDGSLQRLSVDRVLRLNGDVQFLACIFPRDREHTYVFHAEFLLKRLLDRFGRNFVAEDV